MSNRIRYKVGDHEIELEGSEKFIQHQLKQFFAHVESSAGASKPAGVGLPEKIAQASRSGKAPSPSEYFRAKQPRSGTERLSVIAKYLEDHRSITEFKPTDINKLAREAKVQDIHGQYYTMAVRQGLLRTVGKGRYALTLSGEDAVLSMPASKADKHD